MKYHNGFNYILPFVYFFAVCFTLHRIAGLLMVLREHKDRKIRKQEQEQELELEQQRQDAVLREIVATGKDPKGVFSWYYHNICADIWDRNPPTHTWSELKLKAWDAYKFEVRCRIYNEIIRTGEDPYGVFANHDPLNPKDDGLPYERSLVYDHGIIAQELRQQAWKVYSVTQLIDPL